MINDIETMAKIKHKSKLMEINGNKKTEKNAFFHCSNCNKIYKNNSGLWKHEKKPDWWTLLTSKKFEFENVDPLITQLENFRDVILGKSDPLVSGLEGIKSLQVIEAIQTSIIENKAIDISNLN